MSEILLARIVEALSGVEGLKAIVLGGSRARGTHDEHSDYDIGLYYRDDFDFAHLSRQATSLDGRPDCVVPPGGWGPWINGGGWLVVEGQRVDLIYRELGKVQRIVEACARGEFEVFEVPGHPFGFLSTIYAGEVAVCQPLWSADDSLNSLEATFSDDLAEALLGRYEWEAGFSLVLAQKAASRDERVYLSGCLFRAVTCLCMVLHARNRHWWLNEKGAVRIAGSLPGAPSDFFDLARLAGGGDLQAAERLHSLVLPEREVRLV